MIKTKNISNFTELFEKSIGLTQDNSFISHYISGHLMIEFLLVKCVELKTPSLTKFVESINHRKLIELAHGLNLINADMKEVLISINSMRNKLAHNILYRPSIIEYKILIQSAKNAFHDMTDGLEQTLDELEGKNDISECEEFIFIEPFIQISYDLHSIYQDLGGDIENFHA